jgi:hypothetical protein
MFRCKIFFQYSAIYSVQKHYILLQYLLPIMSSTYTLGFLGVVLWSLLASSASQGSVVLPTGRKFGRRTKNMQKKFGQKEVKFFGVTFRGLFLDILLKKQCKCCPLVGKILLEKLCFYRAAKNFPRWVCFLITVGRQENLTKSWQPCMRL